MDWLFPLDREPRRRGEVMKVKWRSLRSLPLSLPYASFSAFSRRWPLAGVASHRFSSRIPACRSMDMRARSPISFLLLGWASCLLVQSVHSLNPDAGPWVLPTQGEPWPHPNLRRMSQAFYLLRASTFQFNVSNWRVDRAGGHFLQRMGIIGILRSRYSALLVSLDIFASSFLFLLLQTFAKGAKCNDRI